MNKLWLDDFRPAPSGWIWVKTVDEAKQYLLAGDIEDASLDHDLGACTKCLNGRSAKDWLIEHNYTQMPNCEHMGTWYTLVCWMEENDIWPKNKPTVHSSNPVGRKKMQVAIDKRYG